MEQKNLGKVIEKLKKAVEKFQECPDINRTWEQNFSNEVVFAIEELNEIKHEVNVLLKEQGKILKEALNR